MTAFPCTCSLTVSSISLLIVEPRLATLWFPLGEGWCESDCTVQPELPALLPWLKDPGPRNEKRTLFCDMVCFLFITPLAAISGWLCLRGAQDHLQFNSRLEAIGLIALTIALFTIYVLWTLVSFRYHCQLYSEWRRTNQKVRLMLPASRSPHPVPHSLLSAKLMKKAADETTV
ncbi:hypothetical protein EK904_009340 [Melospiza melodia maxima]|nr:hypothetical protein EK904_009340 [Melospiza melodia maxima]